MWVGFPTTFQRSEAGFLTSYPLRAEMGQRKGLSAMQGQTRNTIGLRGSGTSPILDTTRARNEAVV